MKNKNKVKSLIAKTFTPKYDELEDRIRVAINYEDINNRVDFMITRSFILNMMPSIDEYILKYYNVEEASTADNILKSNLKNDTREDKVVLKTNDTNLELYRTDEELLIKINFSYDKASQKTTVTFFSKNVIAKTFLDSYTLQQIFKIIKSVIPHFSWGIAYNF